VGTREHKTQQINGNDIDTEVDVSLFWKTLRKHVVPILHRKPLQEDKPRPRVCRFEQMESRQLLSITPIQIGATYLEDHSGDDSPSNLISNGTTTTTQVADLFEVGYTGGVSGTQLTQLTINLNDTTLFDTVAEGAGYGSAFAMTIISHDGFQLVDENGNEVNSVTVADGAKTLTLYFKDFDEGEKLVFSIDVDETVGGNPTADGDEIVDQKLTIGGVSYTATGATIDAVFSAPNAANIKAAASFTHIDRSKDLTGEYFTGTLYDLLPNVDYSNTAAKTYMPTNPSSQENAKLSDFTAAALATVPLSSISGTVFHDYNGNNVQDSGDAGIANTTLTLYHLVDGNYVLVTKSDGTAVTAITNSDGSYTFSSLVTGTYRVVETQPASYANVGASTVDGAVESASAITAIELSSKDSLNNNFAETQFTLSGYVYYDSNSSKVRDTGDSGISGVTVTLTDGNGNVVTTTTGSDGSYSFANLAPGTYRISEGPEPANTGYLDGTDTAGTIAGSSLGDAKTVNDQISGITLGDTYTNLLTLASGSTFDNTGENYNFGELGLSLSGRAYVDVGVDGAYVSGTDIPIESATINLYLAGSKVASTTTAADGTYQFTNLAPGTYNVTESYSSSLYLDWLDYPGNLGGTADGVETILGIPLKSANATNYDFTEILPASVSGYAYVDANNNGIYDTGESPIKGVTVALLDSDGYETGTTATTDANGFYSFTGLEPGTYGVKETQPTSYLDGLDAAGTINNTVVGTAHNPGDQIDGVALAGGQTGLNYNFGELLPASVSGYVYSDLDNDGVYDSGESPIANVTLTLLDSSGKSTGNTTTTDATGFYSFTNLTPGTYGVKETQPSDFLDGLDAAGPTGGTAHNPGDLIDAIPIVSGTSAEQNNFGELLPTSISGRVYADLNDNAAFDSTDTPLGSVTIQLFDGADSLVATTTTDSDGKYSFTGLQPGVYSVVETQPTGYIEGSDQIGTVDGEEHGKLDGSNRIYKIQLDSGDDGINYDFWEIVPVTISGYVFQDGPAIVTNEGDPAPDIPSLRDGKLTSDDTRLAGVTLKLCDGSGYPLTDDSGNAITTTTDANGYYEFTMLLPGDYSVIEVEPTGYVQGIDTAGNMGGLVVNSYSTVDAQVMSTLAVDSSGSAIVKISLTSGAVGQQYNFSEVLVEEEPTTPDNPPGYNPPGIPTPITPSPSLEPYANFQPVWIPYSPVPQALKDPLFGGGGGPGGYTWHLSVIDAGQPRQENTGTEYAQAPDNTIFDPVSWTGADLSQSQWILADKDGVPIKTIHFGMANATPVAGDWDGSGTTKIGVFFEGLWFLDLNGNGVWDKDDLWVKLGAKDDQPVAGDWNGDNKTDIGIFGPTWIGDMRAIAAEPGLPDAQNPPTLSRPKNVPPNPADATTGWRAMKKGQTGRLRSDLIDHVFQYGVKGDIAVTGDWNGDGIYNIGIFRNGVWFLDMDGDGRWSKGDLVLDFGEEGDLPVVGDWSGDGISKLGVYRDGKFILDTNNNHRIDEADKVFALGHAGDKPVSGDWNGDGIDEVGVYENGPTNDVPLQASRQ
jgi:serine-aspartate repeat-containing protein C/D/E